MGRPEKEGRCKKHPIHKNSNGVCPYCLRDKLANISGSSSSSTNNAGSSSSSASSTAYSSYDSDVSSSVASPPKQYEERNKKRIFQLLKGRKRTLKSSLSFSLSKEVEKVSEKGKEEKRKSKNGAGKLWAKLVMAGKGKKNQGEGRSTLAHSMTVKESSSSSKWTFFS
ncbi:vitellogenin-A2 [Dendrobium catenatum]|uniref:Uncharacterized protein n=1 Tax=Dendrobium catenatum TaxID=906689 RepID=A0A2I0VGY5_9ASPA|nr:vitellogenin-A2 [Dendrobium catenatum]PKU62677.1 hypothetical protein MA16_Dca028566 [Dendrobium catenatum]